MLKAELLSFKQETYLDALTVLELIKPEIKDSESIILQQSFHRLYAQTVLKINQLSLKLSNKEHEEFIDQVGFELPKE